MSRRVCEWVAALAALVVVAPTAAALDDKSTCIECHATYVEARYAKPVADFQHDVHRERGLSCDDCHGGDPALGMDDMNHKASMDPAKGYIGVPPPGGVAAMCAKCHADAEFMRRYDPTIPTDQAAQYAKSEHGRLAARGDRNSATCVSCHGAHGVRPVAEPPSPAHKRNVPALCAKCHADASHMKGYGIPTNQYAEYKTSVHAALLLGEGDLRAPSCADCHGAHGAAPPGVESVPRVCGRCHEVNQEHFEQSPHQASLEKFGKPMCISCHSNHAVHAPSDTMLGVADGAVCVKCHEAGTSGWTAAKEMRAALDSLSSAIVEADAGIARVRGQGMAMDESLYDLREAKNALTRARVVIHRFTPEPVREVVDPGLTVARAVGQRTERRIADVSTRPRVLIVVWALVAVAVAALHVRIRRLS